MNMSLNQCRYLQQMSAADPVLSARSRTLPVGIFPRKTSSVSATAAALTAHPQLDGVTTPPTRPPITTADNVTQVQPVRAVSPGPSPGSVPKEDEIPSTLPGGKVH